MKKVISILALFAPGFAFAQTNLDITDVNSLATKLISIGNLLIYLLISLAVIFIIWNVVIYIIRGSEGAEKGKALANIGWGILGLAIIMSIWGLVNILTGTFRTTPPHQTIPLVNPLNQSQPNGAVPVVP